MARCRSGTRSRPERILVVLNEGDRCCRPQRPEIVVAVSQGGGILDEDDVWTVPLNGIERRSAILGTKHAVVVGRDHALDLSCPRGIGHHNKHSPQRGPSAFPHSATPEASLRMVGLFRARGGHLGMLLAEDGPVARIPE